MHQKVAVIHTSMIPSMSYRQKLVGGARGVSQPLCARSLKRQNTKQRLDMMRRLDKSAVAASSTTPSTTGITIAVSSMLTPLLCCPTLIQHCKRQYLMLMITANDPDMTRPTFPPQPSLRGRLFPSSTPKKSVYQTGRAGGAEQYIGLCWLRFFPSFPGEIPGAVPISNVHPLG